MGVCRYELKEYAQALVHFDRALELVGAACYDGWDAAALNRAHCLRKIGRYEEAIAAYQQTLGMGGDKATAYGGMGMCYHLLGDMRYAITSYHQALSLKDDGIVTGMLQMALSTTQNAEAE